MVNITIPIPILARKSIDFLPYLSAAFPQIGEKNAATTKVHPKIIPEYCCIKLTSVTPNCLIYNGSIGAIWLIPIELKNIPIQHTNKFLFHNSI
ncbi:hypothetical protein BN175_1420003 [Clostridioides difficile T23]|uniref:Uncharacterized protein n=1 Tax=Clostridioides difficile TaxID=1496 RepID=A0A069AR01_CLODI|nr:hypothetical protein HMPREF1123_03710 [Clostridioides difficile 050-P50-2011]EHJ36652.1 hypothetical protein HMPREF9945_02786 [Clostridioides difficile 70-100-2010]CCL02079.1 hypothetical protein BN167_1220006 [Clostridioides difficile E13]CCL11230.1 hypothetical protein BN169_690172 [Clostridioides difficile E16]CCL14055.1 hypothetical protein BN170_1600003 [Clostridioides difficile T22]CCL18051.1 hypothetical protein BN171_2070003 [Clostridioides difficile E25]CCL22050.1 hypothetical pro